MSTIHQPDVDPGYPDAEYEVYTALPPPPTRTAGRARRVAAVAAVTLVGLLAAGLAWQATSPTSQAASPETGYDVTAVSWQGLALPVSPTAGPAEFTDTRSRGFAQSELGAALAAVHLSSHIDPYTGPAVFGPTIDEQVLGDTQTVKDLVTAAYTDAAEKHKVADGAPILAPTGQMKAWRIDSYDPAGVNQVEVYVGTPAGADVVYTIAVQWVDGDWKLTPTLTDHGLSFPVTAPDPTLDYTAFTTTPGDTP